MNKAELLDAVAAAGLPEALKRYLAAFISRGVDSRLRRALKAGAAVALEEMAGLLRTSSAVLGVPPEEALFATGFRGGNFAPGRLEAALAELRAVNFLHGEGFTAICLVAAGRGKTPDITAERGGRTYAVEVRCVTGGSRIGGLGQAAGTGAVKALRAVAFKKMPQASSAVKKGGADRCCLVLVLGADAAAASLDRCALAELARKAGARENTHVCLLAGAAAGVWPPWEG